MTSIILMICLTRTTERSSECWSPVTPLWHMPDPQMWPRCVVAEYDDRSDAVPKTIGHPFEATILKLVQDTSSC
jgi:hypothetical protein